MGPANLAQKGELAVMCHEERHLILLGILIGAVVAGVLTFTIFGLVIQNLDYHNGSNLLEIATLIGIIHGAVTGPIVALVITRKRARSLGL